MKSFLTHIMEAPEDKEPASPDEASMAMKQAEFLMYVGREVAQHIKAGKEFPEWMQNKLSGLHEKAKDLHANLGDHGDDKDDMNEGYIKSMGWKGTDDMINRLSKMLNPNSVLCKSISRDADNVVPEFKKMSKHMDAIQGIWEEVDYTISMNESVDLDEDVHARYLRAHGKKASGSGQWMFSTKRMGDVDHKDMYHHKGMDKFSVAVKAAQKHFGTKDVYVMESVSEETAEDRQKAIAKQRSDQRRKADKAKLAAISSMMDREKERQARVRQAQKTN